MLTPEDHVIEGTPGERAIKLKRLGSIGRALGDTEVKIFDEDGSEQPVDEVGEIVARGPRVMKGYWKADEATNSTIRNGWLYTGDIGYMDEAGYIFLSGRAKDIIIRAGENISPEQVEATLHSHPAIDEAAVIGGARPAVGRNGPCNSGAKGWGSGFRGRHNRALPGPAGQLQEARVGDFRRLAAP